ncbi:hypothetical protein BH24CHL1_BH24CHL1_20000 [soil metagenome]
MQFVTSVASTSDLSLETVITRIASDHRVDGILFMGTTGTPDLKPSSDYDVVLVFADVPVPIRMVNTWIDGRLTEVYCTTVSVVERITSSPSTFRDGSEAGAIIGWLRNGRIVHDREGRLTSAREAIVNAPPPTLPSESDIYAAWLETGYNIQQTRRYLLSGDPDALIVVDFRLLFSLDDLKGHYFLVNKLPWPGFKEAVRYWRLHDPDWLARFHRCYSEPDCERKFERYIDLATITFEPVGALWSTGTTAVDPGQPFGTVGNHEPSGSVPDALTFWEELIHTGTA